MLLRLLFSTLALSLLFTGCVDLPEPMPRPADPCQFAASVSAPEPFSLKNFGSVTNNAFLQGLDFLSEDIGYAWGSSNMGGYADIWLTNDGGLSWENRSPVTDQTPVSVLFTDKTHSYLSIHDVTGCPDNCQNLCKVLLTTDGGITWTEHKYPNLKGILYHLQEGPDGSIYASLWLDGRVSIVKSTDQGASFSTISTHADLYFEYVGYSMSVLDNRIVAAGKDGKLVMLDFEGNLIKLVNTPVEGNITSFNWLSDQVWVLGTTRGCYVTTSAGANFQQIREGWSIILLASLPDASTPGILLANMAGECPGDIASSSDILAWTEDGGTTWTDTEPVENLVTNMTYQTAQLDQRSTRFLVNNELFELIRP